MRIRRHSVAKVASRAGVAYYFANLRPPNPPGALGNLVTQVGESIALLSRNNHLFHFVLLNWAMRQNTCDNKLHVLSLRLGR
jgi:hypothetical protein